MHRARALSTCVLLSSALFAHLVGCGGDDGGGGDGATADAMVDPDAPEILSFSANAQPLYEGGTVTFSAVVTDPQGDEDILSAAVKGVAGGNYGTMSKDAPGNYSLTVTWDAIQAVDSITGDKDGLEREFIAELFDADGHRATRSLTLTLACPDSGADSAPCDGVCEPVETDKFQCGGCGLVCPGATQDPLSPLSTCSNSLCQEVRLLFDERMSCADACASRGGECDHDDICPGNQCDIYEQSHAIYGGGDLTMPLDGCDEVPPESDDVGGAFDQLGCNCKNLPAE